MRKRFTGPGPELTVQQSLELWRTMDENTWKRPPLRRKVIGMYLIEHPPTMGGTSWTKEIVWNVKGPRFIDLMNNGARIFRLEKGEEIIGLEKLAEESKAGTATSS